MDRTLKGVHRWRFCRLGGFDQVRLETAEDLRNLSGLDQKLWAALSCPVNGLEFDSRTLAMLDSDCDGRVRVQEVLAAVNWTDSVLKNMDTLLAGAAELPIEAIDDSHPEGRQLLASAKQLLAYLGKSSSTVVSIDDVTDTDSLLRNSAFNGDGIITVQATANDENQKLIEDIMACVGSDTDRSGLPGISNERVATFFEACQLYIEWWKQAEDDTAILAFGDKTIAAASALNLLKTKIDDYFTRCGLAAFDPKAEEPLNPSITTYETLAGQDLTAATTEVERFPLAHIGAGRSLPLRDGINPAWIEAVTQFTELIVVPLFGGAVAQLEADQWRQIKATFSAYDGWQASKAGVEVEPLGLERVHEISQGTGKETLEKLIEQDLALAEQVDAIIKVVKLVYFNRDLYRLLNNFVAFHDFYALGRKAIFQAGTLFIDGRACELCVKVQSVDGHSPLASLSRTYLAYCDCKRRNSSEQMLIAAAFTGGDSDNLMVGRNGVFYDCKGDDWDSTIIKIIDHPISVPQAFWAPYKRIARMFGEQIEKFASAKDKAVDVSASTSVAWVGSKDGKAVTPFDVGKFAGIFAAIGLALGAIGTAIASILGGFLSLPIWKMPLVIAGIILAISGPSMLIAFWKLRQRNLGPILDANGWAVNTKASINIPFGATLTALAQLPKGAERTLSDPFAEKKTPWKRWAFLLVLLAALGFAWNNGYIQQWARQLKPFINGQTVAEPPVTEPSVAVPDKQPEPATK